MLGPKYKVKTLFSGKKVGTGSLSAHNNIFVSSGQSTALFSLPSSCFKMQSDKAKWSNYNHGQNSLGQSVRNFNSVFHKTQKAVLSLYNSMSPLPSPSNTMLKDQRNCALTVSTLSVGWGEGVGTCSVSSARGYNFARVKKRSNCTTVPTLLSMIV